MKKHWIAGLVLSACLLGGATMPARAADEQLQVQLIKQAFRLTQPEWYKLLAENRHLLDASFFERCDARIRWGIENNQIEDALRFSMLCDAAMKTNGQRGTYRMALVHAFLKAGNTTMPEDLLQNISLTDPDDPEPGFLFAVIKASRNDYYGAYEGFKASSDRGFRRDECLYQMGRLSLLMDRTDQGEKELKAALELNPSHKEAQALLDKLVAARPKINPGGGFKDIPVSSPAVSPEMSEKARTILAEAEGLQQVGQLQKARDAYRRAIDTDPNLQKAYVYLGAVLYRMGELDNALGYLQKAVQLDGRDREAWRFLAYAYERRFDKKGARADLDQAIAAFERGSKAAPDDRQFKLELERVQSKRSPAAAKP